jgi:hypothetical protein
MIIKRLGKMPFNDLFVKYFGLRQVEEDGRRWLRASSCTVVVGDRPAPAAHTFEVAR